MKKYILYLVLLIISSTVVKAQWQPLNGPYMGGWVYCLESKDSVIYAGTDGGLYSTANNGNLWVRLTNSLDNIRIRAIKIYDQKIFIATSDSGIYMSDDSGITWSAANNGLNTLNMSTLLIKDTLIFAGTQNGGVYVSVDEGQNWTACNTGLSYWNINCMAALDTILFAGTYTGGVYISHDNGASWSSSNNGITSNNITTFANDSNFIFATTASGIYRSDDQGVTWTYKGLWPYCRAAYMHNGVIYASTGSAEINKSVDFGDSWTTLSTGLPTTACLILALLYVDNTFYAGTWGAGVYNSTNNGNTWQRKHYGMKGTVNEVMAVGNNLYAATINDGICWSDNGGNFWNQANIGLTSLNINCLAHIGTKIFAGGGAGLFSSVNYGITWDPIPQAGTIITALKEYNGILYAARNGTPYLSFSTDTGATWTPISVGISSTVNSISRSGLDIMVGLRSNPYGFYSNNTGGTWNQIPLTSTIFSTTFTSSKAIVGSASIYKSDLTGTNWVLGNTGYPPATSCAALHTVLNFAYAGGPKGIYYNDHTVSLWQDFSDGLDYLNTNCFNSDAGNLYAGTDDGVWVRSALTSINETESENQFSNYRIYPNPNQGRFEVICEEACVQTTIEITDVLGKIFYNKQFQNSENISIELNSVSSGIYMMRIVNGNKSSFQKIVVQ